MRPYSLFISHSWSYHHEYIRLIELLDRAPRFLYKNYSVPADDPIHNAPNSRLLADAIRRQMIFCDVVILLAGVYSTHSKWIKTEIAIANSFTRPKPLLAIEPWGSHRTSEIVKNSADLIVGWSTSSMVSAIRWLA